jgi:hypothetical protein
MKISAVKTILYLGAQIKTTLYLGAQIKFYPHFPHLLSNLGEIFCKRSAHDAVLHLKVSQKLAQGRTFSS